MLYFAHMKKRTKFWIGLVVVIAVLGISAAVAIKLNVPTLRKIYHCSLDQGIKPPSAATGTLVDARRTATVRFRAQSWM